MVGMVPQMQVTPRQPRNPPRPAAQAKAQMRLRVHPKAQKPGQEQGQVLVRRRAAVVV